MSDRLAVITNAPAAGQQSMLGYGKLVIEAARHSGATVVEFAGVSPLSNRLPNIVTGKAIRDIERFILSPIALAGRRADIVHVVDPGNIVYFDVIQYRASVVTVHDMIPYLCVAGKLHGFRPSPRGRRLMRCIMSRLKRADRVVCPSEATRRDILEIADVDPSRLLVIPNTVFHPIKPASAEACDALRTELKIPISAPLIVHVGDHFYKNRATVLKVFAEVLQRIPQTHLVLLSTETPELLALANARNLAHNLRFASFVAASKLATLYTASNLLLFPSIYEGFGYPVLEAQLCGTPVICSNTGALPEVAGQGASLFDPHDIAGMAEAAVEILTDPIAAARIVALGSENACRFSRERWFSAHKSLYLDLRRTPDRNTWSFVN